jgi:hypothetical protein
MKKNQPLPLIALALLLIFCAAGSARAATLQLQTLPSWQANGIEQGERLGVAVAGAGLVNSDLYADILVGVEKGGAEKEGQAKLYLGSASGPQGSPSWQVLGETRGGLFGAALDGAGDVNNDGWDDILVGAANYTLSSEQAGEGAVYLYYGGETGPALTYAWKFESNLKGASLGAAVAGAGYINDDDYADIIVGLPHYNSDTLENAGAAYVFYGSASGLGADYDWIDIGGQASALFGAEVNAAGDVNGDGFDDVLIAAPYYNDPASAIDDVGIVYLYTGYAGGLSNVPAWSFKGSQTGALVGTSAASAGDVNRDGCSDIIIGAPGYNLGELLNAGRAYVFYGCQNESASRLNETPDWEYSYPQEGANFGIDVSSGGDTNGDAIDEVLVGAHLYDDEQAGEGAVFAFFGGPLGLPAGYGWQVEGNKSDTHFGYSVDNAGDTNGDGLTDALLGSPQYRVEELIRGAAFLYFGTQLASIYHTHLPFIRK